MTIIQQSTLISKNIRNKLTKTNIYIKNISISDSSRLMIIKKSYIYMSVIRYTLEIIALLSDIKQ